MMTTTERNMYGCTPCPDCRSVYRWPTQDVHPTHPSTICCDECGRRRPYVARREDGGVDTFDELNAMTPAEEAEVLAILNAVGTPDGPTVTKDDPWEYCANEEFKLSNGMTVVVFNDCDSWDYIDSIAMSDGRRWEYPFQSQCPMTYPVANWMPVKSRAAAWHVPPLVCNDG